MAWKTDELEEIFRLAGKGDMERLQPEWESAVSRMDLSGESDLNALLQYVIRESYRETVEELRYYAERVRHYNELKAAIQAEIDAVRAFKAEQVASGARDRLTRPFSGTYQNAGPLSFSTSLAFDARNGRRIEQVPLQGRTSFTMISELDGYVSNLGTSLYDTGRDSQMADLDLQNMLQKQQQTIQIMANISKKMHDTAMAVITRYIG